MKLLLEDHDWLWLKHLWRRSLFRFYNIRAILLSLLFVGYFSFLLVFHILIKFRSFCDTLLPRIFKSFLLNVTYTLDNFYCILGFLLSCSSQKNRTDLFSLRNSFFKLFLFCVFVNLTKMCDFFFSRSNIVLSVLLLKTYSEALSRRNNLVRTVNFWSNENCKIINKYFSL